MVAVQILQTSRRPLSYQGSPLPGQWRTSLLKGQKAYDQINCVKAPGGRVLSVDGTYQAS